MQPYGTAQPNQARQAQCHASKEAWLATLSTPNGPRLHVRAQGGYVDLADATGDPRFAAFGTFVTAGPAALDAARGLQNRDGREYPPGDFGPAVPAPEQILCLGLNYSEHAPEGRRRIDSGRPASGLPNEDLVTLAGSGREPTLATTRSVPLPAPPDRDPLLRTVDLTRDFGGVHAVAGVSIEVRRGTLTGLIGPNGAGESTLLAMLAGTIEVTSGQVVYAGTDVTAVPAYRRARLGLVRTFQLASEFKRLTVMENLLSAVPRHRGDTLAGALRGRRYWRGDEEAAIDRARALLDRFGLSTDADTYAGDLSGGQRRLTEIMRALMAEPSLLLLDEPMAGVHPRLAREIGAQLLGLCAEGMTILMVEHELAIMDEFADPVVVMADGSVLAEGTMEQLRARTEVVEAYLVG